MECDTVAYEEVFDHMGFILSDEKSRTHYKESQSQYLRVLERRAKRWSKGAGKNLKSDKMRRFIQKGIPHGLRPQMWMRLTGADKLMKKNSIFYSDNNKPEKLDQQTLEQIDLDIPRTFSDNRHFNTSTVDSATKSVVLRRILIACAIKNPQIGYCQGMSYIAAFMFLVIKDEEKTFWLLDSVINTIIPGYHCAKPEPMWGARADFQALKFLIKLNSPSVSDMLDVQRLDIEMLCTKWFIPVYLDSLPTETVLRIWDILFSEGRHILFRVALTLIKRGEVSLASCTALHHVVEQFRVISQESYTWYTHSFIQMVYSDTATLTDKQIMKVCEDERKKVIT